MNGSISDDATCESGIIQDLFRSYAHSTESISLFEAAQTHNVLILEIVMSESIFRDKALCVALKFGATPGHRFE